MLTGRAKHESPAGAAPCRFLSLPHSESDTPSSEHVGLDHSMYGRRVSLIAGPWRMAGVLSSWIICAIDRSSAQLQRFKVSHKMHLTESLVVLHILHFDDSYTYIMEEHYVS